MEVKVPEVVRVILSRVTLTTVTQGTMVWVTNYGDSGNNGLGDKGPDGHGLMEDEQYFVPRTTYGRYTLFVIRFVDPFYM